MSNELWCLSASEIAEGIRKGDFSSRDAVAASIERINETNDTLNALTDVNADQALASAEAADRKLAGGGPQGLLHGVPVSIKMNVDLAGAATVNGSMLLKNNIATENSPAVQNWLDAGAVVVGRSNNPEFCIRWDTSNEVYGATKNPWNNSLTPGGSSGGAAASLAVGMTPLAHGTDIGGSLRYPAQACGITSIRPTFGRVPDFVPTEHEPSIGAQLFNTNGPMARSIADVRLGLQAMAVADSRDPWSVPLPLVNPDVCDLPIAVIVDPLGQGIDDQVANGVERAQDILVDAGYRTEHAEPQTLADAVEVWKNILVWEVFSGLEPAVKSGCGDLLSKIFENYHQSFNDLTAEKYSRAFGERLSILRDWSAFFQRYSVIIAPVSTMPPQVANFDVSSLENTKSLIQSMRMVVAINALGLPSVVVPVGTKDGMPQAVQVIGAPFQEMRCLEVAEMIEKSAGVLTPIDP